MAKNFFVRNRIKISVNKPFHKLVLISNDAFAVNVLSSI